MFPKTNIVKQTYRTLIVLLFPFIVWSQQITTDSTIPLNDLIQNNLADGCVEISNVSSSINGDVLGINSFGLFNSGTSTFPFSSGILLTTGNVNDAGNTANGAIISEGNNSWGTDPDLEAALGINNTLNATSIQFDFISGTNSLEFNYIFASEEYFGTNPCNFSDGFAFLIKETGSAAPFTNLAVLPGTTTPVNTNTIHGEISGTGGCAAVNETFFAGTNASTNYNGLTTVLTAATAITANTSYTIKLIIADSRFSDFDSAVFIQANSFDNSVNLGDDISTCNTSAELNATVDNPNATYEWSVNGTNLPGFSNMPIITVTQSETYQVDVSVPLNGNTCTFSDTITVAVNNNETIPALQNIQLCDDASNDGEENFSFAQANAEFLTALPALTAPDSYTISYHVTNAQAESGNNPITNTTTYPVTSSPETIFVRAVNNAGCVYISFFNLIINPFPIITDPTDPFFACVNDGGADLNTLNDGITGGNPDYTVTYHTTPTDASTGSNPLAMPYTPNTTTTETIYISISTSSGCIATADVDVTVSANPVINNTDIQQIDACQFGSEFETFDITSVEADILNGLTGMNITYHENLPDAEIGANPIADPTAYTNTTPNEQNVYIRVEDPVTGCATIHFIELHTFLLVTGTDFVITPNPVEFPACDNDGDGIVEFDLGDVSGGILNDVEDTTVQFYENDPVANPGEPELDQNVPYTINTSGVILFVSLNRTGPSCSYNDQITLIINPGISIDTLTPQDYCDADNDLSSVIVPTFSFFDTYLQTRTSVAASFAYFPTLVDAENVENAFPSDFEVINPASPYTVFFRATNSFGCFAIGELDINFLPAPSISAPTNLFECTTDGSTTAVVDLTSTIAEINNNANVSFTFHELIGEAQNGTDPIPTPAAYNTGTRTVFARVVNNNGCFAIQSFNVTVNNKPNPTIPDYLVCLPIGQTVGDFFFETEIDPIILASGLNSGVTINYFEDYNSTTNVLSNPIDKTIAYNNTALSETIFVEITYINDPTCSTITSFNINVGELPDYDGTISTFATCDDSSNDGSADFNLEDFSTQLANGSSQSLTITYYETLQDANDQNNAITNTTNYNNGNENPKTIFYNVDNGTVCKGVAAFELQVTPIPSGITPSPITVCDTNTNNLDGFMPFDLTSVTNEILADITDRDREDIILNYFPSQGDFDASTNQITTPNNYTNITNPQTIVIQILNTATTCFDTVNYVLNVDVPPTINANQTFEACDNTANEFDLTTTIIDLIGSQANVNLEFYTSLTNAETQTDEIANPFNYSTNNTTLFVRANFNGSTCFNTGSFVVQINNRPALSAVSNLETCDNITDNNFDLIEPFNLGTQTAVVLGGLNPANHTVTYHISQLDAEANANALTNLNVNSLNGTTYFIRVENNTTNCVSYANFETTVFRKPQVELEDQALCLDNLPLVVSAETGVSTDSYLWSNGAVTPSIAINTVGTFSVTITTANGCTNSDSFSLVESEAATIDFTETVDFSSPNNSITISVSGIGNYLFQLDGGLPQASNVFQDVSYGVHLITVIDELGCNSVTKEVIVFDIPPFFTPNADNYNDTWHIIGVEQLEGTIVYIFDRYGKLLKTLTHTSQGWNGFYNGYAMPTSDYWYVAKIKQGAKEFELKGHFTLKR